MKYFYNETKPVKDHDILFLINQAAERLHKKFTQIDLKQLNISEYNQSYLTGKLQNPIGMLQHYSYLLALTLTSVKQPLSQVVLIDYGGGSGVLSLLAQELGIGIVIYNDIYDVSCQDIKILAKVFELDIADFVCGDIDELIIYLNKQSISINAIISSDVIEHIYDIENYLRKLHLLSNSSFSLVFSSTANSKNPILRWQLKKQHIKCEYKNRELKWGHKERDTLRSYFEIRKEIISNYHSELSSEIVENIAKSTRGLIKQNIEKCVDEYIKDGKISYKPDHPTNTCDPYTGNWVEHLMNTKWLENILRNEVFEVKILSGYWKNSNHILQRLITELLNLGIKYLGTKALYIAPYYIVCAEYDTEKTDFNSHGY